MPKYTYSYRQIDLVSNNVNCQLHVHHGPSYTCIYSIWHDLDMWKMLHNISKYHLISQDCWTILQFAQLFNIEYSLDPSLDSPGTNQPKAKFPVQLAGVSFRIPIKLPQHPEPVQHSANQCNKNSTVKMAMQTLGVWKNITKLLCKKSLCESELLSYNTIKHGGRNQRETHLQRKWLILHQCCLQNTIKPTKLCSTPTRKNKHVEELQLSPFKSGCWRRKCHIKATSP